ncbi:hypothetical protein K466DRAFT_480747, partial [Polyporus arcularius HHB13444]
PPQRYCLGQGHAEVQEVLQGVKVRHEVVGVADPEMAVVDNCCHIKNAILAVFPAIAVVLDVWHFMMRYMICVVNGSKNPHRAEVAHDLVDAIVKCTANNNAPAVYRSQSEQETRLQAVYDKWAAKKGVWTAAAAKTHAEQLAHVKKGCLSRPRDDVRSDGSRIEGVHKGFNSLQRSFASGLVMMTLLLHDYILRRNIRNELARSSGATPFVSSTHGSHHVRLVNAFATLWNRLITAAQCARTLPSDIHRLPEFVSVNSGESFGLVKITPAVAAQQSFVTIKEEPEEAYDLSVHNLLDANHILDQLGVDPALLLLPLPEQPGVDGRSNDTPPTPAKSERPVKSVPVLVQTQRDDADSTIPHVPTSSHVAAGAADVSPLIIAHLVEGPPPKKKTRLHVAGTPSQPSSSRYASVSAHTATSSTQGGAAGSSATAAASQLHNFFGPRRAEVHANSSLRPCVPMPTISGTTPSQRLFSIATGIKTQQLSFSGADKKEFFLFMDLRERHRWASFSMSPFDWVSAASVYNQELQALNAREGRAFVKKTPRALMEQLAKMEAKILGRLATGNFTSKESGSTAFWTRHCHAVSLTSKSQTRGERFNHTCSRCQKLMYPGKTGAEINHRKAHCSDGVWQKPRTVDKVINGQNVKIFEAPPQYPQPAGVFSRGSTFHPVAFLQEVQTLYERVIERQDAVTMQDLAFANMLNERSLTVPASDGHPTMILFKLFSSLATVGTFPESLLVDYDGHRYLRMHCLDDATEHGPR